MNSPTTQLAIDMMARQSVTPEDAGCQEHANLRRTVEAQRQGFDEQAHQERADDVDEDRAPRHAEADQAHGAGIDEMAKPGADRAAGAGQ